MAKTCPFGKFQKIRLLVFGFIYMQQPAIFAGIGYKKHDKTVQNITFLPERNFSVYFDPDSYREKVLFQLTCSLLCIFDY